MVIESPLVAAQPQTNENVPNWADSGLNILIRPNRLPVVENSGHFDGAFIQLPGGEYLFFSGTYLGEEGVVPADINQQFEAVLDAFKQDLVQSGFAARLYDRLNAGEAGLIMGEDTLGKNFLQIAARYGIDATFPSKDGFRHGIYDGVPVFNVLTTVGDNTIGPINLKN